MAVSSWVVSGGFGHLSDPGEVDAWFAAVLPSLYGMLVIFFFVPPLWDEKVG